jgi:hypothetical protein
MAKTLLSTRIFQMFRASGSIMRLAGVAPDTISRPIHSCRAATARRGVDRVCFDRDRARTRLSRILYLQKLFYCRGKSQPAIHLLAANLASGSILSRMRSTGFFGASAARVIDRIESALPIMIGQWDE